MSLSATNGAGRHAIVLGGGIAGLVAARVLTDHFDRVTVLERDKPGSEGAFRAGVPQSRHAHVLLAKGHACVEQLFPGIGDEMEAAGAPLYDVGERCISIYPQGRLLRRRAGVELRLTSRMFRERLIRRRVVEGGRVSFREGVVVQGLVPEGCGVAGVRIRNVEGGAESTVFADLVVAACGREAPVVDWLVALGYPAPREVVVDAGLSYSSRWYRFPRDRRDFYAVAELPGAPDRPRGGVAFMTEHDTWVVTLMGTSRIRTPTDESSFNVWVRALDNPHIHELITEAEPISPIYGYARTDNRRRLFDRMPSFPERFVVLGDAAASLNPLYGQGMTVGALGALELGACLEEQRERVGGRSLTGLSRRFQRCLARMQEPAWVMATAEDFRWPGTSGERPGPAQKVAEAYFNIILRLATRDPVVHTAMLRVTHMVDPMSELFRPDIVSRVLECSTRPVRKAVGALVEQVAR
ncbi:FAD-dependent oxidoreductase [Polyangium spumosum]|uniref:2-polyprenyl-6-methoxyphenol hydroxylase-like oxidoreductase n=1 Tax=Polyangium spumosum TaxID=889282 RepID=A0A6N7PPP2_9BACT|nr:FAD-dependent monooxygenase [Polyangium spumosum]MRG93919.1 2-polyprenyl-6-methoxyphenol hydroxylase-like oxidoreductase [Polyangium spumosum]